MHFSRLIFSIIIPIFNADDYLPQCLDSISGQTYTEFQVILVDDGSTDKSGLICDEYAKRDTRFSVIHQDNQGVSSARNIGMEAALGDYVIFIDSDDWIEKDALENILNVIEKYPYDIVMYGIVKDFSDHESKILQQYDCGQYLTNEQIVKKLPLLIKNESVNSPIKVYKKTILKENTIKFDTRTNIAEDLLFNIQCFLKAESLFTMSNILYHYMIRKNTSLSRKFSDSKYERLMFVNNRLLALIKDKSNRFELKEALVHIRLKNIYSCFMDVFKQDCNYTFREKLLFIKNILALEKNTDFGIIKDKSFRILACIVKTNMSILNFYMSKFIFIGIKKGEF